MRDPWTGTLPPNFTRAVLGYDRRVRPSRHQQQRSDIPWVGDWFDLIGPRITYETLVWPSQIDFGIGSKNNGYDLIQNLDDAKEPQIKDDVYVAFDLPESFSEFLYPPQPKYPCNPSFSEIVISSAWAFMGFDIVDVRDRSSAMYSFNWESDEITQLLLTSGIQLNAAGAVEDSASAISACKLFSNNDLKTRSHAPFVPCGIWVSS